MKNFLLLSLALSVGLTAASASKIHSKDSYKKISNSEIVSAVNSVKATSKVSREQSTIANNLKSSFVETKKLANGVELQINRSMKGDIYKSIILPLNAKKLNRTKHISAKASNATQNTLYENFEGWDGVTSNWIPSSWSQINSTPEITSTEFSWNTAEGNGYNITAVEGDYCCSIHFYGVKDDENIYHTYDQDEWLVTPAVTPKETDKLFFKLAYSPLFMFNLDEEHVDWSMYEFTKKEKAASLIIMVKEGDGEWTQIHDFYDDYTDYDLWTLISDYGDTSWYNLVLDISQYAGKNVQFAFRYKGNDGDTMCLDAIKVGAPSPEACYYRPEGNFYFGFDDEYNTLSTDEGTVMLAPAYTDMTWGNTSNDESESFEWNYSAPNGAQASSTDADLEVRYDSYSFWSIPELTAMAAGADNSTYHWRGFAMQTGGAGEYTFDDGTYSEYGVGNYDFFNNSFFSIQTNDGPLFGNCANSDKIWGEMFFETPDEDNHAEITAIGNYFEKPTHPYALSKVTVKGAGTIAQDAEIKLHVIRVTSSGSLADTLATATCSGSDIVKTEVNGDNYLSIPFELMQVDPETSLEDPVTLTVSDAIFVSMDVRNDGITDFGAFQSAYPAINDEVNAYFFVDVTTNGKKAQRLYDTSIFSTSLGTCYASFLFNLDATYTWLVCDDTTFNAAATGDTKTFDIDSYSFTDEWNISIEDATAAEWLSYTTSDDDSGSHITFTAKSLPDGVAGRSCDVTITIPGSSITFNVGQGTVGVNGVKADKAIKVTASSSKFAITYPSTVNNVKIYNVAGQLVKSAALNGGYSTIDAQNLGNGIYMLKFNDGATVKVIK